MIHLRLWCGPCLIKVFYLFSAAGVHLQDAAKPGQRVARPQSQVAKEPVVQSDKPSKVQQHKALVGRFSRVEEENPEASEDWELALEARAKNLECAVSDRTGAGYHNYWWRFEKFCGRTGRCVMPFDNITASSFLSELAETSAGLGGVDGARAALSYYWGVKNPGVASPTDSSEVRAVIHGIKRRFQVPVKKKEALTVEDFSKLLVHITEGKELEELPMVRLRLAAQIGLMFCTFCRFEEAQALKLGQVKLGKKDLVVDFLKGKQYQHGEARLGMMPQQPNLLLDPTRVLRVYISRLEVEFSVSKDSWLFPAFTSFKGQMKVLSKPASYDCVRRQFKTEVAGAKLAGETADYGLHSMRRGAVSGAINNGCSDHQVMKQMRVSSVATVQRYASLNKNQLSAAVNILFNNC